MTSETPTATTSFVGRRHELTMIRERLIHARILTLTGPGGIGKTRLAEAIATDSGDRRDSTAVFVPLDESYDEASIILGIVRALRLSESAEAADLVAELCDRPRLIVLDNCEHVLQSVSAVADRLARACPHLRIVATSRTSLPGAGLDVYAVPPMALPNIDGSARSFDAADAVRLFVERAMDHDPAFVLSQESRADVGAILHTIGGLPLMIEFAAARLRELTLSELATSVTSPGLVASWSDPLRPIRQQTLDTSIAWSAALASEQEHALWIRLAVFDDSFDIDAVEAVCTDHDLSRDDALDLVQGLVEQSVLQRFDDDQVIRYGLSPAAREFGRRALAPATERQLRNRLARWQSASVGRDIITPAPQAITQAPDRARTVDALTPREEQVAALVTGGLTNRQIAARLLVAPRTVDGHVQHLFTKLGFRSRSQIAAWVAQRDLPMSAAAS